jgi:hypothetical protein
MLHSLAELYQQHPVLTGAVVMALANAAITAMPSPRSGGSQFYAWAFNFLHSAVGAISRVVAQYKNGNGSTPEAT